MLKIYICDIPAKEAQSAADVLLEFLRKARLNVKVGTVTTRASKLTALPPAAEDGADVDVEVPLFLIGYEYLYDEKTSLIWAKAFRRLFPQCYIVFMARSMARVCESLKGDIIPTAFLLKPLKVFDMGEVIGNIYGDYRVNHAKSKTEEQKYISICAGATVTRIRLDDILYFESALRKVNVYTENERFTYYDKLTDICERFGDKFVRCHNSYVVSVSKIGAVHFGEKTVVLKSGTEIPISRTFNKTFKEALSEGGIIDG